MSAPNTFATVEGLRGADSSSGHGLRLRGVGSVAQGRIEAELWPPEDDYGRNAQGAYGYGRWCLILVVQGRDSCQAKRAILSVHRR